VYGASGSNSLRSSPIRTRPGSLSPSRRHQADAQLRNGARVDAVFHAFEFGLCGHLRELAKEHRVPTTRPDGRPLNVSRLNDDLRKAGVYGEADRAQVEAWSKLRNDLAHPKAGTTVGDSRVDATIAAIRVFVEEHPVGDALAVVP